MSYETSVLIANGSLQILAVRNGASFSLPKVRPEPGRPGIALSRAVKEQLHLEVFCLVPKAGDGTVHPLRLQSEDVPAPPGYRWIDLEAFDEGSLQRVREAFVFDPLDRRVGQFAWYPEAQAWLRTIVRELGYQMQALEQWNGRVGGVLLRVITDGPQFWFKAVSDFNIREFAVAQLLTQSNKQLFPKIVATHNGWRGLLLEHINGTELFACDDLTRWVQVAEQLADLQMSWMGCSDPLLHAGAADLRAGALVVELPRFLEHVEEAMSRQTKNTPDRLTRADLDEVGEATELLCAEVDSLAISESLANADFSPHNTLLTPSGPVFIDWAEACVSLPLITGEYLWNRMAVESPERRSWQPALREAYFSRWLQAFDAGVVDRAKELLPAFSVLAVAMFYHQRESHGSSPYDAYLRSLARKLKRELEKLSICALP